MSNYKIDRPVLRAVAISFALLALFGWDWGAAYRTKLVDLWELPILSVLLFLAALMPLRIIHSQTMKFVVPILLATDVFLFCWWCLERAKFENGTYDFGAVILRLIFYGILFPLLLPKRIYDP